MLNWKTVEVYHTRFEEDGSEYFVNEDTGKTHVTKEEASHYTEHYFRSCGVIATIKEEVNLVDSFYYIVGVSLDQTLIGYRRPYYGRFTDLNMAKKVAELEARKLLIELKGSIENILNS